MREIKFRLRVDNKIVGYERWDSYRGCWEYSPNNKHWDLSYIPHNEKDQFTGLHDKNGKEIYEGDILKDISINGIEGLVYKVGFRDGHFTLTGIETGYDKLGIWNVHYNQEIIGNIYENPELLKEAR